MLEKIIKKITPFILFGTISCATTRIYAPPSSKPTTYFCRAPAMFYIYTDNPKQFLEKKGFRWAICGPSRYKPLPEFNIDMLEKVCPKIFEDNIYYAGGDDINTNLPILTDGFNLYDCKGKIIHSENPERYVVFPFVHQGKIVFKDRETNYFCVNKNGNCVPVSDKKETCENCKIIDFRNR